MGELAKTNKEISLRTLESILKDDTIFRKFIMHFDKEKDLFKCIDKIDYIYGLNNLMNYNIKHDATLSKKYFEKMNYMNSYYKRDLKDSFCEYSYEDYLRQDKPEIPFKIVKSILSDEEVFYKFLHFDTYKEYFKNIPLDQYIQSILDMQSFYEENHLLLQKHKKDRIRTIKSQFIFETPHNEILTGERYEVKIDPILEKEVLKKVNLKEDTFVLARSIYMELCKLVTIDDTFLVQQKEENKSVRIVDQEKCFSNIYATPQINFERNGWLAQFRTPVKWLHYSIKGQHDYVNVAPSLYLRRTLTAKSELSTSLAYRLGSPQAYLNIDAPVLADYRNMFIATNPDKYTQDLSASVSYRYRNPMKSLFFNLSATYNYRRSYIMSNQFFVGDMIISSYSDCLSGSDTWYLKTGLSKGLGHSKMVVGFDADASRATASAMRDNVVVPYRQLTAGIKPYFKGSVLRWLSVNYEASYGFSRLSINHEDNHYHSFRQNVFATILPLDEIEFTFGMEHFLNSFSNGNTANLLLLDASAVWRLNNKIRLSLTATNLLNKRSYEYQTYGTLSSSTHMFQLRPRSILASIQYSF